MRRWNGYQLDRVDVGRGDISIAENVSFSIDGQLSRRSGLKPCVFDTRNFASDGNDIRNHVFFDDGSAYIIRANTNTSDLESISVYGGTKTVLGGSCSQSGSFHFSNGRLYYVDGITMNRVNGQVVYTAGITGPSAAPTAVNGGAGLCTIGTHLIRYRYRDSATGYISNTSPITSITLSAVSDIDLTLTQSGDAKVNYYDIEMTLSGGSTFYKVGEALESGTTYTINVSDAVLSTQQLANIYAGPDGYGHDVPPVATISCEHRGRVFLCKPPTPTIYWSRSGNPESFNTLNWARKVTFADGSEPTGMIGYQNDLYIFSATGIKRMIYTDAPETGMLLNVSTSHGIWNNRCICYADGDLYGFGAQGMFRIAGIRDEHISRPIDTAWAAEIDDNYSTPNHFVFYDPRERTVHFMYLTDENASSLSPTSGFAYETQTRQWKRVSYLQQVMGVAVGGDSGTVASAYLCMAGDVAPVFEMVPGFFDGVPESMSTGVVTTAAGSTTTVLNVNESLASPNGVSGAQLYVPSTGLSYQIASNTANTITLQDALPGAPAAGVTYHIGAILVTGTSDWVTRGMFDQTSSPLWLQVDHLSDTAALTMSFQIYKNFASTATAFTLQSASETPPLGVTITDGSSTVSVDTSYIGAEVPMPFSDAKVYRWSFTQSEPKGVFKLLDVAFRFDDPSQERIE